jgi:hypothetical protein
MTAADIRKRADNVGNWFSEEAVLLRALADSHEALVELRRHCPPTGVRISMALQMQCDKALAHVEALKL